MRKLRDYEPFLTPLLKFIAPNAKVTSDPGLSEILKDEKKMVIAFNHAAPLSWAPAVSLLTREVVEQGGGDRLPRGIMDQFFFQFPPLRPLAKWIAQSNEFLSFDELVEDFENADQADLVVFPEGSNCFFGPSDEIQKFRSPKFIEIAVRADAPILIAVHAGSESWGQTFKFPPALSAIIPFLPSFAQKGIASNGLVNIPMLPKPIEDFRMHCEIYRPKLKARELSKDQFERREQLLEEAAHIHHLMETILENLRAEALREQQAKLDSL